MSLRNASNFCAAMSAFLLIVGCGGDGSSPDDGAEPGDEIDYELFDSTRELDEAALADLRAANPDGTLEFDGTPSALEDVERLQVVLARPTDAAPHGLLRLVTNVRMVGSDLVLETVDAPLQLAFRKLHLRLTRTFDEFEPMQGSWSPRARRTLASGGGPIGGDLELPPMDGDGDPSTLDDQLTGGGNLSGEFTYVLGLDVDWGEVFDLPDKIADCVDNLVSGESCNPTDLLPELVVGYEVTASAHADVHFEGVSYLSFEELYTFEPKILDVFVIGPVAFTASLELTGAILGEASSQFSLAETADLGFSAGVSYSTKEGASGPNLDFWDDFTVPAADATLKARSRIEVTPSLHLRAYGVAGPYAGLTPWAELRADHEQEPCWRLMGGADGLLGIDVRVDIPGIAELVSFDPWSHGFTIVGEQELLNGSCPPLEGGEVPTSGAAGEPTENAFVNPDFEPWSKAYDGAVVNHAVEGIGAQVEWTRQTPTFDGRFLVTGSNLDSLVKLGRDGEVVWAKRYEPPEPFNETVTIDYLLPSAAFSTKDVASLVVAHPWTLLKIDPSGDVLWVRHFDQPHSEEVYRITAAAPAAEDGFYLLGNFGEDVNRKTESDTVLVRVDTEGAVVWARRFGNETEGERGWALIPYQAGVVAAGAVWNPDASDWTAFSILFDDDGDVVWSKRVAAPRCDATPYSASTHFTTGLATRDGDVLLAGTAGRAPDATLIVKVKPDGSLGWAAADTAPSPHLGPTVSAIVELPTTGYLAAGTYHYWEGSSVGHDEIWLGALDGIGRVQWMKGYGGSFMEEPDGVTFRSDTYPSLSLTQDGGALLVGYTQSFGSNRRNLVGLKVPAKNGEITFDSATTAQVRDLPIEGDGRFCFELADYPITPVDHPLAESSLPVTVLDAAVQTRGLTAP